MRLREGYRLRPFDGQFIVTSTYSAKVDFSRMISLNETAAFLWNKVEGIEFAPGFLADLLVSEYGIDRRTALTDSEQIARQWIDAGLAEN